MTTEHGPLFQVTGRVKQERVFSLAELLKMDIVETGKKLVACGSGEPKGYVEGFRGVLLTDVINLTEVITTEHNDTKKMFLVARSDDGYSTVFSWQEIFNTSVGEGVMIVLEKEGTKVYDTHGGVDLISASDFLTGPRYVKQLSEIEIIMAGEW